jgi:hypothetical protein
VQKVGLVLVCIDACQQPYPRFLLDARVVAGGNKIGSQFERVVKKCPELDFPVTDDIRTGGAPGLVFIEKMPEYTLPVFSRKTGCVQFNVNLVGNKTCICQVLFGRAVISFS